MIQRPFRDKGPENAKGAVSPRLLVLILCAIVFPIIVFGAAPAWWSDREVIAPDSTPNDYAAVNQGQVKNIAKAAVAEFDAHLPGGAGATLHNLVSSWTTPTARTNDYAAVNLGQLKALAEPFYDRLIFIGYTDKYPWLDSPNPANDYAMANIGQVKNLFSFEVPEIDPPLAQDMDFVVANDAFLSIALQASGTGVRVLTYSIVSGPAHGALSGSGSEIEYIPMFPFAGTDTLTYKANDGVQDSNIATVTILVKAPPSVFAGANQTVALSGTATLNGVATDLDTSPAQVSCAWTKKSGPGVVSFANPFAAQTTATFSAPGTYQLMLIASDDEFSRASTVTVQVNADAAVSPVVILSNPGNTTVFTRPTTINFSASASSSNSSIAKVEFYQGPYKLGESSAAPFIFAWQNPWAGTYSLTARAVDAQGVVAFSEPVVIKVINPGDEATPPDPNGVVAGTVPDPGDATNPNNPNSPNRDTDGDDIPDSQDTAPNDPRRWKDVPVTQLAVINMSQDKTGGQDVRMVALDDENRAAFGFSSSNQFQVYSWENGSVTLNQSVITSGDDSSDWRLASLALTPSGKIWGEALNVWTDETVGVFFSVGGVVEMVLEEWDGYFQFNGASENGFFYETTHDPNVGVVDGPPAPNTIWAYEIAFGGGVTRFVHFKPSKINNSGWAIGSFVPRPPGPWTPPTEYKLWNGSSLRTFSGDAVDINDHGYVISSGTATSWVLRGGTTQDEIKEILPDDHRDQIKDILPKLISNVDQSDNTFYIVFSGKSLEGNGSGTWVAHDFLLRVSDAKSEVSIINLPDDVTADFKVINKNGVIAATGKPPGVSKDHALLFLPIDITVRKKGEAVPDNGVLVKVDDIIEIAFAPQYFDQEKQFENVISWEYRHLKANGSLGPEWHKFSDLGLGIGDGGKGTRMEVKCITPSIRQIRAIIKSGTVEQEYFYVRKKDDPNGADSNGTFNENYRKGKPDYVGAANEVEFNIVRAAQGSLGSTGWGQSTTIALSTGFVAKAGEAKCNIFLYQIANPLKSVPVDSGGSPPRAYDWYNSGFSILGWTFHNGTALAEPGTGIARYKFWWLGFRVPRTSAHCGITDYDGAWINAGSLNINRYPHITDEGYQPANFRN